MGKVNKSPKSKIDIWRIAERIAADNFDAAVRMLGRFDEAIGRLGDFPGLGPSRDELRPGLRSFPVGDYVLLYRVVEGGIEVVRVIHGARDLDQALDE